MNCSKEYVADEIVKPFLSDSEFYFGGAQISSKDIAILKIYSTEKDSEALKEIAIERIYRDFVEAGLDFERPSKGSIEEAILTMAKDVTNKFISFSKKESIKAINQTRATQSPLSPLKNLSLDELSIKLPILGIVMKGKKNS